MLSKERLEKMGLRQGAIRNKNLVHNGGWYNTLGEKIGWGDLSENDFSLIQENLHEDEVFVVLREFDSFWNFVTKFGMFGNLCSTSVEEKNPGQEYLIDHAVFVITRDEVYPVYRYLDDGIPYEELVSLIKGAK